MTDDSDFQDTPDSGNYVPIEELEALADEWERDACELIFDGSRDIHTAWGRQQKVCADELKELIAEYRSGADE